MFSNFEILLSAIAAIPKGPGESSDGTYKMRFPGASDRVRSQTKNK